MNRYSRKRLLVLLVCICFIMVPVLSMVLFFTHTAHGCTEAHCPVCDQIHNGQNLLKQLLISMVALLLAFEGLSFTSATMRYGILPVPAATPHALKTRMNN